MIEWFLRVVDVDGMSGAVRGVREWPRPGGLTRQAARLVSAVDVIRAELSAYLAEKSKRAQARRPTEGKGDAPGQQRKGRRGAL